MPKSSEDPTGSSIFIVAGSQFRFSGWRL